MPGAPQVRDALIAVTDADVFMISAVSGHGLHELVAEIMTRVEQRREALLAAGEEVTMLRQTDQPSIEKNRAKRVPPHLAGPTAQLSNDLQAKDYDVDQISGDDS